MSAITVYEQITKTNTIEILALLQYYTNEKAE